MANELSLQERLQPALLDRLIDDEPDKKQESRDLRIISIPKLRAAIMRDLTWLLNTVYLEATVDLARYPQVRNSVLNYGIRSVAGSSIAEIGIGEVERAVKEAILRFEPRLLAKSVEVSLLRQSLRHDAHNSVGLQIEAMLWAQPMPLRMFMKTELDLEIGAARVVEQTETSASQHNTRPAWERF